MRCATSPASPSAPAKAATRATRLIFAASPRRTTCSATAFAIRAGTRATPSRSTRSKSTRARRRSCSAAARPAASINLITQAAAGSQLRRRHRHRQHRPGCARDRRRQRQDQREGSAARVVVMGQRYDIPGRDHVEENRWGVAPSLKCKPNDQHQAHAVSYIYQHDNNVPDYGIPFLSPAWGIPRRSRRSRAAPGTASSAGRLRTSRASTSTSRPPRSSTSSTTTSRSPTRRATVNVDHLQRNVFPEPNASVPPPPNLNTNWTTEPRAGRVTNTMVANQTDVLAKFNTGPLHHTVAAGVEVSRKRATSCAISSPDRPSDQLPQSRPVARRRHAAAADGEPADLRQGHRRRRLCRRSDQDQPVFRSARRGAARSVPLQAGCAARGRIRCNISIAPTMCSSWRVGAVFHPTANTSVYVMRGTSFNPTADNLSISVADAAATAHQPDQSRRRRRTRPPKSAPRPTCSTASSALADRRLPDRKDQLARAGSGQLPR